MTLDNKNNELINLSAQFDNINQNKFKIQEQIDTFELILKEKDRLYLELNDVWKDGEMKYFLNDINSEINQTHNKISNELNNELDELNKQKYLLEDRQQELLFELEKERNAEDL